MRDAENHPLEDRIHEDAHQQQVDHGLERASHERAAQTRTEQHAGQIGRQPRLRVSQPASDAQDDRDEGLHDESEFARAGEPSGDVLEEGARKKIHASPFVRVTERRRRRQHEHEQREARENRGDAPAMPSIPPHGDALRSGGRVDAFQSDTTRSTVCPDWSGPYSRSKPIRLSASRTSPCTSASRNSMSRARKCLVQLGEELRAGEIDSRHRAQEEHHEPHGIRAGGQKLEQPLTDEFHVEVQQRRLAADHQHAGRAFVIRVTRTVGVIGRSGDARQLDDPRA